MYLIEQRYITKNEAHSTTVIRYEPIGYVDTDEEAVFYCSQGNRNTRLKYEHKLLPIPEYRYTKIHRILVNEPEISKVKCECCKWYGYVSELERGEEVPLCPSCGSDSIDKYDRIEEQLVYREKENYDLHELYKSLQRLHKEQKENYEHEIQNLMTRIFDDNLIMRKCKDIIEEAPEINPSNYTHTEVVKMNNALCELYELVKDTPNLE